MNLLTKVLPVVCCDFFTFFCQRTKITVGFLRPIIRQDKFPLLHKNGGVVPKSRAASIEISGSPMEASLVNMIGRVERLI